MPDQIHVFYPITPKTEEIREREQKREEERLEELSKMTMQQKQEYLKKSLEKAKKARINL